MFQGLRTVVYHVADIEEAKAWWTRMLGQEPYFDQPFYVGFNVGGYELGLHPIESEDTIGAVAYWGVEDVESVFKRLTEEGGMTVHQPIQEVGGGIKVAAVHDGSSNIIGIIENPHFSLPAAR